MKKLMFISPVMPDANGGGRNKRAHQWLHKLSKDYQIHLLVIDSEGQCKGANMPEFDFPVASLRVLTAKFSRPGLVALIKGYLKLILLKDRADSSLSNWVRLTKQHKFFLQAWYEDQEFDKLICFRIYLNEFALFIRRISHVSHCELDMDDFESETWKKLASIYAINRKWWKAYRHWIQSVLFSFAETRLVEVFQRVYVCSKEDQEKLSGRYSQAQVSVFPNRMPKNICEFSPGGNPYNILFIGSLGYYPNEDAVRWFVTQVMPKLLKTGYPWKFTIVGYGASIKFSSWLSGRKGVKMLGEVKDLRVIYREAGQVVVPLRAGGGTKLKVMEAMLYGCPLVASSEAAYGLEIIPDKYYLHADTAEEFVSQCLHLAENPLCREEIVQSALAFVEQKYVY